MSETLEFIRQNPKILSIPVEIKDIHGQRLRGKPLQILAAAGEFNSTDMKAEAKPYGLVPLLYDCFPNPQDFKTQLEEHFKFGYGDITHKRMAHVKNVIEIFINDVVKNSDISNIGPINFGDLLNSLPIVRQFREAIKPNPNDVVTSGFAWDLKIFIDFIQIFEANFKKLGGKSSNKSKFVEAVVWPALQARSSLCDLEVFGLFPK